MTQNIQHPEWRDARETTKYPFSDSATLVNSDGDFLPETLFLDAVLYPVGADGRFYLSQVIITGDIAEIHIGDSSNSSVASVRFDPLSPPASLRLTDSTGRPAGMLLSETTRLAVFQTWDVGTHNFSSSQTEFVARVCVPTPEEGVRGIVIEGEDDAVTGQVYLVGENGVVFRRETVTVPGDGFTTDETHEVIRMDIVGDPLFRRALCGNVFTTPRFLQQITIQNGETEFVCTPDARGDITFVAGSQLAADTVLRIKTTGDGGMTVQAAGERVSGIR